MADDNVPNETTVAVSPDKKKRRIGVGGCMLICLGMFGLLVLCPVTGYFIWSAAARARVEAKLAEIRAKGEPTNTEELGAAYVLREGAEDCTLLWIKAIAPFDSAEYGASARDLPIVGNAEGEIPPPGTMWKDLEKVEAFLDDYAESMQLIHQAADKGGYARFDRDFVQGYALLLPEVQQLRGASRMLKLEAHVYAHRGDVDGTMKSMRGMFAVGHAIDGDPILVSQLVQMAVDAVAINTLMELLPHVDFTDAQLAELQQLLRKTDYKQGMRQALMGERVLAAEAFRNPALMGDDMLPSVPLGSRDEDLALYLELMSEVIDASEESWAGQAKVVSQVEMKLQDATAQPVNKLRYVLTAMTFPALSACHQAGARSDGTMIVADVILATERYKLANGKYPTKIDELVPMYLPTIPIDPYDDNPIRYEVRDSYPVVWSIGKDGVDDGGEGDSTGMIDLVLTVNPAKKADDESESDGATEAMGME